MSKLNVSTHFSVCECMNLAEQKTEKFLNWSSMSLWFVIRHVWIAYVQRACTYAIQTRVDGWYVLTICGEQTTITELRSLQNIYPTPRVCIAYPTEFICRQTKLGDHQQYNFELRRDDRIQWSIVPSGRSFVSVAKNHHKCKTEIALIRSNLAHLQITLSLIGGDHQKQSNRWCLNWVGWFVYLCSSSSILIGGVCIAWASQSMCLYVCLQLHLHPFWAHSNSCIIT